MDKEMKGMRESMQEMSSLLRRSTIRSSLDETDTGASLFNFGKYIN